MEKKYYQKPITELNYINNSSFIAASTIIIEGETGGTEVADVLDKCFKFDGTNVSDAYLIEKYFPTTNTTMCVRSQIYEKEDVNNPICEDPRFKNLPRHTTVKVTYLGDNKFAFDITECTGWKW